MDRQAQEREKNRLSAVERIAHETLGVATLKPRNSDSLDFHEVSVWDLRKALELAFIEGQRVAVDEIKKRLDGPVAQLVRAADS